jgi:hypothetical protein
MYIHTTCLFLYKNKQISKQYIYVSFENETVKKPNITAKLSKKSKTKRRSSHLYDVLYHVRAYAVMQL